MKKLKVLLVAGLAILGSAGCASGPSFAEYQSSIPSLSENSGRLWFYRPEKFLGAAVSADVKVNGEVVGKSTAGGFFFVDRPAGQYTVTAATEAERALQLTLSQGDQKYVRMEPQMGLFVGTIKLVPVEPAVGQKEIAGTQYSGPTKK